MRRNRVDERDVAILKAKEQDARATAAEIAAPLGITPQAVQLRLLRLQDRGVLSYRAVVDYDKVVMVA